MRITYKHANVLLQGINSVSPLDDMWYLDTGASSHRTSMNSYQSLDKINKGIVRFGNGFSISLSIFLCKGEVHVDCTNGEYMIFKNVLCTPKLKSNILILGKLDSEGCDIF